MFSDDRGLPFFFSWAGQDNNLSARDPEWCWRVMIVAAE
jgi:hypothetical protein